MVGISPSYLNLIEHNRRRIGGRLLNDIARNLAVDPVQLGEGAQRPLAEALARVLAEAGQAEPDAPTEPADELARRFPGWARLVLRQHRLVEDQAGRIAGLTDRLSQDPQLAATLHDVLSVATAIRSTAGILATGSELDPDWLGRFHRNIYKDSQRLAESARGLVAYLDQADEPQGAVPRTPQEELEAWLGGRGFHLAELETRLARPEDLVEALDATRMTGLRPLALAYFSRYATDAAALPADRLRELCSGPDEIDPRALAERLGVPFGLVLRRCAALPPEAGIECGLIVCDSSGAVLFNRPVTGFAVARFGPACPLLPLYTALAQTGRPVRDVVRQAGYASRQFRAYAVAEPIGPPCYDGPRPARSTMLLLPVVGAPEQSTELDAIGPGCRLCLRRDCAARREPSILSDTA